MEYEILLHDVLGIIAKRVNQPGRTAPIGGDESLNSLGIGFREFRAIVTDLSGTVGFPVEIEELMYARPRYFPRDWSMLTARSIADHLHRQRQYVA